MLKLILAHIVAFFLIFAFGLPAAGSIFHTASVGFSGGFLAAFLFAVSCEIVMFAGAALGRLVSDAVGLNPLLQKHSSGAVSAAVIAFVMLPYFLVATKLAVLGLSLDLLSAGLTSLFVVAVLFAMMYVKRFYITHFVKG